MFFYENTHLEATPLMPLFPSHMLVSWTSSALNQRCHKLTINKSLPFLNSVRQQFVLQTDERRKYNNYC